MASALPTAFLAPPRNERPLIVRQQKPELYDEPYKAVDTPGFFLDEAFTQHETKSLRATLNIHPNKIPRARPLIVGHRGCLYDELENTREGFLMTAKAGADAVELDVFLLKCGTLVVFHGCGSDEHPGLLHNYCKGIPSNKRSILDYTYQECRNFVFNRDFEEFGCHPSKIDGAYIPTLEQVLLDAKETGIIVKIELKGPGTAEPVLELVDYLEMQDQCHYSSFDLTQIATVRRLKPELLPDGTHMYKTGALFNDVQSDFCKVAQQVGADEVHLRYDECTRERVQEIHRAGMDSMAWFRGPVGMRHDCIHRYLDVGNEDASMYETVMQSGVGQMCVNRPSLLVNMLSNQAEQQLIAP